MIQKSCRFFDRFGELNYRKNVHPDLLELVRFNERCAKAEAKVNHKVCPVCGGEMLHVCRVANKPRFDYELFEDKFVLDVADCWVRVDLPFRKKKKDIDVDGAYDDFVKKCG